MKYKEITSILQKEILSGALQGNMPPVRSLMQRFSVSNVTVMRVFEELTAQGLLHGEERRSYKIVETSPKENLILCISRPPKDLNETDNFASEITIGIQQGAFLHHKNTLFPHQNAGVLYQSSPDDFLLQMCSEMKGLLPYIHGILCAESISDRQLQEYILPFAGEKPVVVMNRKTSFLSSRAGEVIFSAERACRILSCAMLRSGCESFILCEPKLTIDHRQDHIDLIRSCLLESGVEENQIGLFRDLPGAKKDQTMEDELIRRVSSSPGKCCIFCASSIGSCYVAQRLGKYSMQAGREYKLCSLDGKSSAFTHIPRITTVAFSGLELGRKSVELLLSEDPLRQMCISCDLIAQETL